MRLGSVLSFYRLPFNCLSCRCHLLQPPCFGCQVLLYNQWKNILDQYYSLRRIVEENAISKRIITCSPGGAPGGNAPPGGVWEGGAPGEGVGGKADPWPLWKMIKVTSNLVSNHSMLLLVLRSFKWKGVLKWITLWRTEGRHPRCGRMMCRRSTRAWMTWCWAALKRLGNWMQSHCFWMFNLRPSISIQAL